MGKKCYRIQEEQEMQNYMQDSEKKLLWSCWQEGEERGETIQYLIFVKEGKLCHTREKLKIQQVMPSPKSKHPGRPSRSLQLLCLLNVDVSDVELTGSNYGTVKEKWLPLFVSLFKIKLIVMPVAHVDRTRGLYNLYKKTIAFVSRELFREATEQRLVRMRKKKEKRKPQQQPQRRDNNFTPDTI